MSAMRGFLVVLALSLHEMFEGIALGLATTERFTNLSKYFNQQHDMDRGVWLLLLAIGSHKFIIALCIGQQLVTNRVNKCLVIIYIATFSLTTILGAGAGQTQVTITIAHNMSQDWRCSTLRQARRTPRVLA